MFNKNGLKCSIKTQEIDEKGKLIKDSNPQKLIDDKRDSFCNLQTGDILAAATEVYLRENGDKDSRIKYIIQKGSCVQVLDSHKRVQISYDDTDPNTRQGGYIYVGMTSCPTN